MMTDEFDQGEDYRVRREAGTEDWLWIVTVAGAGLVRAGGERRRVGPGEAVLFRPGAGHDYGTDREVGHWRLAWVHFYPRAHWLAWLTGWPEVAAGVSVMGLGAAGEAVLGAMRRAMRDSRRPVPGAIDFGLNGLEEAWLWAETSRAGGRWARVDERVRRAMDYLAEKVDEPFEMERLARGCGCSVSRLAHRFKEETGESPQRFSEGLKMERAKGLLARTTATVGEVAQACGYEDAFYFSRRFAKATGQSPSGWRRGRLAWSGSADEVETVERRRGRSKS